MKQILGSTARALCANAIAFGVVAALATELNAASNIAYWNFNALAAGTAGLPGTGPWPTSISADQGTGTISLSGINANVNGATGTTVDTFQSYQYNEYGLNALALLTGTAAGTGTSNSGNGEHIDISFPLSGQSNIGVSYATYKSSAVAFNANQWSYSTDGVNFAPFGSVINPVNSGYGNIGPLIATGLSGFTGTATLRYTLSGAGNTASGSLPLNRIDNLLIQSSASAPPAPNAASLPANGDIVFGLNNTDSGNTLEFVRGPLAQAGGVRYPAPVYQYTPSGGSPTNLNFIESVRFDNLAGVSHNAHGNLVGINFGAAATGGQVYSLATTGSTSSPAAQLIGATNTSTPIGSTAGAITVTRLAGLSVSPDNSKIAVVGTDTGRVIAYDYTAGNSAGAGASLANGRQTSTNPLANATQGTAWKDNSTILAFSAHGNLVSIDATSMAITDIGQAGQDVVTPEVGSNVTSLYYNPTISPYLYASYSGFLAGSNPPTNSITKIYVFDPTNNYALLTTQAAGPGAPTTPGIDLSGLSTLANQGQSSMTARDLALDKNGNLFIGGFDSTITYLPAADFASPATIAAIPHNSAIFYYGSTYDATAFPGLDVSLGASAVGLAGDYNGDGKVDAADYVTWRKNPGANGGDPAGYTTWRNNFGLPGAGSGLSAGAVPEPTSIVLLLVGMLLTGWRQRRSG